MKNESLHVFGFFSGRIIELYELQLESYIPSERGIILAAKIPF